MNAPAKKSRIYGVDAPADERFAIRKDDRPYAGCGLKGCSLPRQVSDGAGFVQKHCSFEHSQFAKGLRAPESIGTDECALPGCSVPVAAAPGSTFLYCCLTHDFMDRHRRANQALYALLPTDFEYKSVVSQYERKWLKGAPRPVVAVFRVVQPEPISRRFEAYKLSVVRRDVVSYGAGAPGNVQRRWHGTSVRCSLGTGDQLTCCLDERCRACRILREGFDIAMVRKLAHWARFGPGHYFSGTTSKSAEYPLTLADGERRVLFLAKCVVGHGQKLVANDPARSGPDSGFDSVLGEVGAHINYDELVLYRDDAVLLCYAVFT